MGNEENSLVFSLLTPTSAQLTNNSVDGKKVAVVPSVEEEYQQEAEASLLAKYPSLIVISFDSYPDAVNALENRDVDLLLFFEGFREMIEERFTLFSVENKVLDSFSIPLHTPDEESDIEESSESSENEDSSSGSDPDTYTAEGLASAPFVIFLTGTDSRSTKISTYGNHDVNIIAVVNPVSKVILLISTPRDFYVDVPYSSMKDKLTHAGCYSGGVKCSAQTISMLYDIPITRYIKIGFTGFSKVVDLIGGIDVYSEVSFKSRAYWDENGNKYTFEAGVNHLSGGAALAFVRERYNLDALGGDRQRGKNQMEVIKAIIKKCLSPEILLNYVPLLNTVKKNIIFNFSESDIASLVNMQLHDNATWRFYSYSVNGTGSYAYTASYPNEKLYVMKPKQATIDNAKQYIQEVWDGKLPSIAQ